MEVKHFVSPNDTIGKTDSESIQNAVNLAHESGLNCVVIPRKNARTNGLVWEISETILLPSNITVLLEDCHMVMADDVMCNFFRNENAYTEKATVQPGRQHNITIRGIGSAVLDGGKTNGLDETTSLKNGYPHVSLNTPIFFINVTQFAVENISITNHRYWGMRFEFCSKGKINNIYFDCVCDRRNQDGINLRNGCYDIVIENINGQTGDDMIALSAIDTDKMAQKEETKKYNFIVAGEPWDIHDVVIRNVSGAAIHHPLVALRNSNGAKMYNITIENVTDTKQTRLARVDHLDRYALIRIGNNSYHAIRPSEMGETYGITVRNVHANFSSRVLAVQATLKNCHFSNLHASASCNSIIACTPKWANGTEGVKMENVVIDGVFFKPDDTAVEVPGEWVYPEDLVTSKVVDLSIMREEDYVKNLYIQNVFLENVQAFAEVDKNRKDAVDIKMSNVVADKEESKEIKYV